MIRLSQIGQQRPPEPAPAPAEPEPAPTPPPPPLPSLASLLETVAAEHGVTVDALRGRGRMKPLPRIRQEFCLRALETKNFSSTQLGRALNRDHTSVLYLLGRLERKPGGENNRQGFQ